MAPTDDGKLVLLVEDNEDNRVIYTTILRHYGYQVEEATTGLEALESALRLRPDLMILDIALPELDGWTVAARLKEDPATRELPILVVTAQASPDGRDRAVEAGCAGFLVKPVRPQRVFEEVRRLIGEARVPATGAER
jgi:two-component system, cell cycle response regulator DivK